MKKTLNSFANNVSKTIKSHFNKNPNDLIAIYFGIFVLAFILLITPQIPQNSISSYAEQPELKEEPAHLVNNDEIANLDSKDEQVILKATLK